MCRTQNPEVDVRVCIYICVCVYIYSLSHSQGLGCSMLSGFLATNWLTTDLQDSTLNYEDCGFLLIESYKLRHLEISLSIAQIHEP